MTLPWLLLGMIVGAAIAYTRCFYVDEENKKLRAALSNVRVMLERGNTRSAVRAISRALEDECAA